MAEKSKKHSTKLALHFYEQHMPLMGSEASIILVSPNDKAIADIFREVWLYLINFERSFSRFIPANELMMFNRNAGIKVRISEAFEDLLTQAKHLSEVTDGLYNPFILPALQRAGYTKSFMEGAENDQAEDFSKRSVVPVSRLTIKDGYATIPYGTAIDLGGCGKGYAADRVADMLDGKVNGYSISLGGDLVCNGVTAEGNSFKVKIEDYLNPDNNEIGEIVMPKTRYSVATSGINKKRGHNKSKNWHHIIDPRTLKPALTDIGSSTVLHDSALYSDVLASCSVILGAKDAVGFLHKNQVSDYIFQPTEPKEYSLDKYRSGEKIVIYTNQLI